MVCIVLHVCVYTDSPSLINSGHATEVRNYIESLRATCEFDVNKRALSGKNRIWMQYPLSFSSVFMRSSWPLIKCVHQLHSNKTCAHTFSAAKHVYMGHNVYLISILTMPLKLSATLQVFGPQPRIRASTPQLPKKKKKTVYGLRVEVPAAASAVSTS